MTADGRQVRGMTPRTRFGAWGVALLGGLAALPLACAGKSIETGNAEGNGGSAGSAGASGSAGQAGSTSSVNRFPCGDAQEISPGLERCGTYTRRTGAVTCQGICADDCTFGCLSDSGCLTNQGCDCLSYPTSCVPVGCTSNADCAAGFNCASYSFGCGNRGYACQLPSDECASADDCNGLECEYTPAGRKCTAQAACYL